MLIPWRALQITLACVFLFSFCVFGTTFSNASEGSDIFTGASTCVVNVGPLGNDNPSCGSASSPPCKSVRYALQLVSPSGCSLNLAPGTYFDENVSLRSNSLSILCNGICRFANATDLPILVIDMANVTISGTFYVSSSSGLIMATSSNVIFSSASVFGISGTVSSSSGSARNLLKMENSTFGYFPGSVRTQSLMSVSGSSILDIYISNSVFDGMIGNASAFAADVPNAVIAISGSAFYNSSIVATDPLGSLCVGAALHVRQCDQISLSNSYFSDNMLNCSAFSATFAEVSWFGGAALAVLNVTSGVALVENSTFVRNSIWANLSTGILSF